MQFDRYVHYISKHRRAPEGVPRPKAIHLGAAEGYVARIDGKTLSTPSVADVERRTAQVLRRHGL